MEILIKFKSYLFSTFDKGSFGLSIIEIISIVTFFIIAVIARGLFAKIIVLKIKKIVQKTGNKVDDKLFYSLSPPLKTLPLILVLILM